MANSSFDQILPVTTSHKTSAFAMAVPNGPPQLSRLRDSAWLALVEKLNKETEEMKRFWETKDPATFIRLYGIYQDVWGVFHIAHYLVHQVAVSRPDGSFGSRLETRREALDESGRYFGYYLPRDGPAKIRISVKGPTNSRFTRLPVELQLAILDHLPLHEADLLVRQRFQHLVVRWCSALPVKFESLFRHLCSPDNMRYMGAAGVSRKIRIFRLRSLDLHPLLQMQWRSWAQPSFGWADKSPVPLDPETLYTSLYTGFLAMTWRILVDRAQSRGGRAHLIPIPRQCRTCHPARNNLLNNHPYLFSLHNFRDMQPCRWRRDGRRSDADLAFQRSERTEVFSRVLIYADELVTIIKTFEIMMRPIFSSAIQGSALRPVERHIIPMLLLSAVQKYDVAASHLMKEYPHRHHVGHHPDCLLIHTLQDEETG